MDQASAKTFFADKVIFQAQRDGVHLSDAEKYMLSWSESDPNFVQVEALTHQFERETTDRDFEARIAALLQRAFDADVKNGRTPKDRYREAYDELKKEDHYILVIIEAALGAKLKKFWLW